MLVLQFLVLFILSLALTEVFKVHLGDADLVFGLDIVELLLMHLLQGHDAVLLAHDVLLPLLDLRSQLFVVLDRLCIHLLLKSQQSLLVRV